MERMEIHFDGMVSDYDRAGGGTSPSQPKTMRPLTESDPGKTGSGAAVTAPLMKGLKMTTVFATYKEIEGESETITVAGGD